MKDMNGDTIEKGDVLLGAEFDFSSREAELQRYLVHDVAAFAIQVERIVAGDAKSYRYVKSCGTEKWLIHSKAPRVLAQPAPFQPYRKAGFDVAM
jgi:hypothetical protein